MAKSKWKGGALLAPVPPVLVTTGSINTPNVCTAAWCGMASTRPPRTYVSLRPQRHSYQLIEENGEFVLNLPTAALVKAIDYCGVKSGRDENKFETCGLTPTPSFDVAPPQIEESPVSLECRVLQKVDLGSHHMFLADILCVCVNEDFVDKNGKLNLGRAGLCTYAHGTYYSLGQSLGTFGFSVKKKKSKPRRK